MNIAFSMVGMKNTQVLKECLKKYLDYGARNHSKCQSHRS